MLRSPTIGRALSIAASLAAPSGCGGSSVKHDAEAMAGAGGAASVEPAACASDIPSAEQIAATPRAFPNLELLALKFSNGIVADQRTYDRLVDDVKAIDQLVPELAEVTYRPRTDGRSLILSVDAATYQAMQANTYDSWNCLNDAYVVSDISFIDFGQLSVFLKLKGTYNMRLVSQQYEILPGVTLAEAETSGQDGPKLCVTQDNATWHYVFDQASGDCPAGCIDHKYTHFTTSIAGDVTNLGEPTPEELGLYGSPNACN